MALIMEKQSKVLATWIMCPDGVMLPSFYNHDYRDHTTVDYVTKEHPEGTEEPNSSENFEAWKKWHEEARSVIAESRWSMVDGGPSSYGRRGGVYTEMSVYEDDPYEVIRRFLCRGGRGKDSKQPLTWVPLFRIDDDWLDALIKYEEERNPDNRFLPFYIKEKEYRKENNIQITKNND